MAQKLRIAMGGDSPVGTLATWSILAPSSQQNMWAGGTITVRSKAAIAMGGESPLGTWQIGASWRPTLSRICGLKGR